MTRKVVPLRRLRTDGTLHCSRMGVVYEAPLHGLGRPLFLLGERLQLRPGPCWFPHSLRHWLFHTGARICTRFGVRVESELRTELIHEPLSAEFHFSGEDEES